MSAPPSARFPSTDWSCIEAARDPRHPTFKLAVTRLITTYWRPVFHFLRAKRHAAADAEDLTQEFFARRLGPRSPAPPWRRSGNFWGDHKETSHGRLRHAERHAIQEVEPEDQLQWLLEEVDDDLEFFGWQQTQVAPPPGVPQLRCDCVAGLHSRSGTQPPWACLIEGRASRWQAWPSG